MSFGFGPEWARGTTCCGKPVGCTNMSGQCRMLGHPWKRWHRQTYGQEAATPGSEDSEDSVTTPAANDPMRQEAPFPAALAYLVDRLEYRPGWTFRLADHDRGQGSQGLTLIITTLRYNSYRPQDGETYRVSHYMPVPPAAFDARSWQRRLFEQCLLVERHECMEFFTIHDSPGSEHFVKPYAPSHGPGNDPYLVREVGTDLDQRTSFRGEVNPPPG